MRLPVLAAFAVAVAFALPAHAQMSGRDALRSISDTMNAHLPGRYGSEMAVLRTRVDDGLLFADVLVSDRIAASFSHNEGWSTDVERLACAGDSVFRDLVDRGVTVAIVLHQGSGDWAGEIHFDRTVCP